MTVSPERIGALLRARTVAVVGASDRSAWSRFIHRNLTLSTAVTRTVLVNPRQTEVHGERAYASLLDVDGQIELAFVLVRAELVCDAMAEVVARGISNAVVIASGFAEGGPEGRQRGEDLRALAERHELTVVGPNTLGFVNIADGLLAFASKLTAPFLPGPIGVATQSGGLASQLLRIARARGVGMATIVGVGNETVLSATDVMRYYLEDERIRVIGTYLEGIRDVAAFRAVAERALEIGKPIVALKVGRSRAGQRAATSHTGALVGDDGIISAAFDQLGVVRVDSLDEFIATAGLLTYAPRLSGRRVGIIGSSGAAVGIMAEWAEATGLDVPELDPATVKGIDEVLDGFGHGANPLDATGLVVTDPTVSARLAALVTADPNLDFAVVNVPAPEFFAPAAAEAVTATVTTYADAQRAASIPTVLEMDITIDLSPELAAVMQATGTYVARGIDLTFRAIRGAIDWNDRRMAAGHRAEEPVVPVPAADLPDRPDELTALRLLTAAGAPVVPFAHVHDAESAAAAAGRIGQPVAVKVVSAALAHKSDVGGVALGLGTSDEVAAAYDTVVANAARVVGADRVDGAVVVPMRQGGIELFVSVSRAGEWGTLLTVGLGGVWVEILHDTASRLLPLRRTEIIVMFTGLRAAAILSGARGGPPVDLDRLAAAVAAIVAAAQRLGDRFESLEINPLWVRGEHIEALDALLTLTSADRLD